MDDADLAEAARLVRPYLPELVGAERAVTLDRRIGAVLARWPAHTALLDVLTSDDAVLRWVEEVLDDPRLLPPDLRGPDVRTFEPVPGGGDPIPADRFTCPVNGDVVWYRPRVGTPVPVCGTHGRELVRS